MIIALFQKINFFCCIPAKLYKFPEFFLNYQLLYRLNDSNRTAAPIYDLDYMLSHF